MALQVWLPLNGDLTNNGIGNPTLSVDNATVDNSGKLGKCYSFNGSTSCINITYSEIPNILNGDFSICMWIYNNDNGGRSILFGSYALTGGFFNLEKQTNNKIRFYWNGSPDYNPGNAVLTTSAWTHLVITRKDTLISIYINGVLTDQGTYTLSTVPTTNVNYRLGRDSRSDATAFNGKMNDFRLYSHALSPKEVEILARGLVLHYPMTGGGRSGDNLVVDSYVNTTSSAYGFGVKSVNIIEGKTYTVSARGYISDAAVTSGTKLVVYFYKSDWSYCPAILQITTTSPSTIFATFTATQTTTLRITSYSFKGQGTAGDPVTAIWYKVEEGDKATPWMPNSADTEYTSMGYNSTTEYDVSGYNRHATLSGTRAFNKDTARYLVSSEFTKSGYLNVSSFGVDTTTFTVNLWVNPRTATSQHFLFGTFNSWPNNGIGIYRDTNGTSYSCLIRSNAVNTWNTIGVAVTLNTWQMLTLTYDGTYYKAYLNGVLKQTNTYGSSGIVSNPVLMIANSKFNSTPASENEEALISDVRMYATALTPTQIQELYNTAVSISNNGTLMGYELIEN